MSEGDRTGELLGSKYRLERLLGSGGMGHVYRANNELIGRAVAIKVLRVEHAANATFVDRFLREARAANLVRHPNVVDVVDIGQDESGSPFIVQELLEGEDLAERRRKATRPSAARASATAPFEELLPAPRAWVAQPLVVVVVAFAGAAGDRQTWTAPSVLQTWPSGQALAEQSSAHVVTAGTFTSVARQWFERHSAPSVHVAPGFASRGSAPFSYHGSASTSAKPPRMKSLNGATFV